MLKQITVLASFSSLVAVLIAMATGLVITPQVFGISVSPTSPEDLYISTDSQYSNYPTSDNLNVNNKANNEGTRRSMIRFDLSPNAGGVAGGDGTLHLFTRGAMNGPGTINVHHIHSANPHGDNQPVGIGLGQWWGVDHQSQNPDWSNDHSLFDATTVVSSFNFTGGESAGAEYTVAVPEAVIQEWLDGNNWGLGLKLNDEGSVNGGEFGSVDDSVVAQRPFLTFELAPVLPEPTSLSLLGMAGMMLLRRRG